MRSLGHAVAGVSGLVLAVSALTGWYETGSGQPGPRIAVTGWDSGGLGKLVAALGLALALVGLLGVLGRLPRPVPWGAVEIALGGLGAVAAVVRLLDVPAALLPATDRGAGLWLSLLASLAAVAGGVLAGLADGRRT